MTYKSRMRLGANLSYDDCEMDFYNDKKIHKEVRSMATQACVYYIQDRLGGISLGKMQKVLLKSADTSTAIFWSSSSRRFYKNAKGVRIKDKALIDAIDKQVRGTKYLFNHPLWLILENPFTDLETVHELMHKLPIELQSKLFKKDKTEGAYDRKEWKNTRHFQRISMQNDLDALACMLMIIREMEILQKWHRYAVAKRSAHQLFLRLAYFPPLNKFSDRLYRFINRYFIQRNNPIPKEHIPIEFMEPFFESPKDISSTHFSNDFLSGILYRAEHQGLVSSKKDDQLYFLFWAFNFGIQQVDTALRPWEGVKGSKALLKKLVDAYNASNTSKYLKNGLFFD